MRFNYEDLKRGNVTKDRIKEVVHSFVLKLDKDLYKQEELERLSSTLLNHLEKIILFHTKQADLTKDEEDKQFNEKKFLENQFFNESCFFIKIESANIYLMIIERMLFYIQSEKEVQRFLNWLDFKKRDNEKWAQYLQELQNNHTFNDGVIHLIKERDQLFEDLLRLRNHHVELTKHMLDLENQIIVSRNNHISNILSNADHITFVNKNGSTVPFFKNNTEEEKRNFIEGRELIREAKIRAILDLKQKRNDEIAHLMDGSAHGNGRNGAGKPINTQFQVSVLLAKINNNFNEEKEKLEKKERELVKDLMVANNIADIKESSPLKDVSNAQNRYDNNSYVEVEHDAHDAVVEENHMNLRDIQDKIARNAELMREKIDKANSLNEKIYENILKNEPSIITASPHERFHENSNNYDNSDLKSFSKSASENNMSFDDLNSFFEDTDSPDQKPSATNDSQNNMSFDDLNSLFENTDSSELVGISTLDNVLLRTDYASQASMKPD